MNVIWKKIVSGIATLFLCMSAISVPIVQADDPTPAPGSTPTPSPTEQPAAATSERKLYLDFLGREDAPTDLSKLTAADVNKEFWVGIGVDKVDDLSLFTNGVYSVEVAIEFDKSYLAPYTSNEKTWHTALTEKNLTNTDWDPITYELWSETNADRNAIKQSDGTLIDTGADTQICTVGINVKQGQNADNARFKGLTDDSKQYLAIIPFTLLRVPGESENPYPIVLDIVRAPEALNIGAGADGKSPRSVWEISDTTPAGIENMHTLFKTNDKLSLFGSDGAISDIVPIKPKTGDETDDTRYTLFKDKPAQQSGFDPDTLTYYLSVSEDVKKLKLEIASSGEPTVTANGTLLTTSPSGGNYVSSEFELLSLNKDVSNGGEADGFNNVVTVEAGGKTYTIYIRQLLKPKIVLNPGNSPYGLIEAMRYIDPADAWDDTKVEAAKTDFNDIGSTSSDAFKDVNLTPLNGKSNIVYTTAAWQGSTDPIENMDRNIYSIFAYNGQDFMDTGFKAYDSLGDPVDPETITRTITVKAMQDLSITGMKTLSDKIITVTNETDKYTFTELLSDANGDVNICPGKYEMKYSFIDPITNQTVKNADDEPESYPDHADYVDNDDNRANNLKRRYIVYVWNRGDTNMSGAKDVGDRGTINELLASRISFTGISPETEALYKYRIADANMSGAIDVGDRGSINELLASRITNPEFYKNN